jgi:site-specific recombinase XerD
MTQANKNIIVVFEEYMNTAPLPSRTREGASEKTIKGYVRDVSDFLQWWKQSVGEALTAEFLRKDPFALNKKTIQDYVNYLERSVAIATLLRKVSSLRAFVKFLQVQRLLNMNR